MRLRLAAVLSSMGALNHAYSGASDVLKLRPDNPRAHMLIADVALRSGLPALAVEHAQAAVAAAPQLVEAKKFLAKAHLQNGSLEAARTTLETLLLVRPDDMEVLVNAGSVYSKLGDRKRALQAIGKASEIRPDSLGPPDPCAHQIDHRSDVVHHDPECLWRQ